MIYLDNAATTEIDADVARIGRVTEQMYGNAHALYWEGEKARLAIEDARRRIAKEIDANDGDVYFTSGATEGNNWCIQGAVRAWWREHLNARRFSAEIPHIITGLTEHHSVLNVCRALEDEGWCEVTYLPPDENGAVRTEDVVRALKENTLLVSLMFINNETGTKNPVEDIGEELLERGVLFHIDATQALGKIRIDLSELWCDMLTGSGHKFHAGKGRGFAYIRGGVRIANLMEGGAQQLGRRPGTEDTVGAVCLAEALSRERDYCGKGGILKKAAKMRERILEIPDARINGSPCLSSGIISVGFKGVESEALLAMLENRGVICSGGSACTAGTAESSHVLEAMRVPEEYLKGTIRISIGAKNTDEEIDEACEIIRKSVEMLRVMGGYDWTWK